MSEFKREIRYTVIKHSQLTESQMQYLKGCIFGEGIPTVKAVVVEADWPEYEPVWSLLERRAKGLKDQVGTVIAKTWLVGAPRVATLYEASSLPDGAALYLAPPFDSGLAEVTLQILKQAKDIPDGLYARAKFLANQVAKP